MDSVLANTTTAPEPPTPTTIPVSRIVISTFLLIVTIITIFGNAVVLIAFATDKKLRTTFTMYIANLAVTDFAVGLTAMSFYTFDVLLGYWPFGQFLCGLWVFCDYGMTFASVFTLVAISMDRFWSVTWHVHYRANNNKKKVWLALTVVWLAVLVIWLPPCVYDRVKWSEPGVCKWEPSNNQEFVVVVAIIGHHIPCFTMLFCYMKVFYTMQKRSAVAAATSRGTEPTSSTVEPVDQSEPTEMTTDGTTSGDAGRRIPKKASAADREKKIFVTLSYILFTYLACWVPFHVVFDVSAVNPDLVPNVVFVITFWLTYLNSTLNPFVYAYCSPEFRAAFVNVMKCAYCRKRN